MSDSLKDQLMQLGFKPKVEPRRDERPRGGAPVAGQQARGRQGRGTGGAGDPRRASAGKGAHSDAATAAPGRPGARAGAANGEPGRPDARTGANPRSGRPAGSAARGNARGDRQAHAGRPPGRRAGEGAGGNDAGMDLARAYALRQREEQAERARAEQARQDEARLRREARQKLAELLEGKSLNAPDAELARHFEFGGKIRRVHVTDAQFKAINAGDLGVVQLGGRYLLVDAATAREAAALVPGALALLVDPSAAEGGEDYSDPRYQVPDDLVW